MRFVYAIAFVGDRFVMVRHRDRSWEMPGGSVEKGEEIDKAVLREFREETGMSFVPISNSPLSEGVIYFGLAHEAEKSISEEIEEVRLFDELPENLSFPREEYELMLQRAREVLKKYINSESIGELLQVGQ